MRKSFVFSRETDDAYNWRSFEAVLCLSEQPFHFLERLWSKVEFGKRKSFQGKLCFSLDNGMLVFVHFRHPGEQRALASTVT